MAADEAMFIVQAPELPGIDLSRITRVDEGWLPHLIVDAGAHRLSIIAEIDFEHPDYPYKQPWPLIAGVVEIGLLGKDGLLADPLRRVALPKAAVICARVTRGELDDFDVEGWGL